MSSDDQRLPDRPKSRAVTTEVDAFLRDLQRAPPRPAGSRGRLIFALDATASREPTWDRACRIQGEMFEATSALGGVEIQLVFYRGFHECKASRWLGTAADLHRAMRRVACVGGETQIGRVLAHALREARAEKVNALVFVGDAMEEKVDTLAQQAGELGLMGVPVFIFKEGGEDAAARAFRHIAKLSGVILQRALLGHANLHWQINLVPSCFPAFTHKCTPAR